MHVQTDHVLLKFNTWSKGQNRFPAYVQAHGSFCHGWSLTLLSDCLDIHNWSDYEGKGLGFEKCKKSENDPIFTNFTTSHLKFLNLFYFLQ